MFKKVLLAGALLAPVLAYGARPSTDLSVQIVPAASPTPPLPPTPPPPSSGIACDIGPNYTGSIPAAAQAAGFTHCAANYDFTQSFYATLSNWLDCAGASNPQWYVTEDGLPGGQCPPNTTQQFSIVNDGGTQVLQLQYTMPTDYNNGIADAKIATASPEGNPNPPGTLFPQPIYVESVVRLPSATQNNFCPGINCIIADSWSWSPATSGPIQEYDFIEMYGPSSNTVTNGGGYAGFGQVAEPGHLSGYDPTIYHNYATRITMDSSGNAAACNYLDGSQISANSGPSCVTNNISSVLNQRHYTILEIGPQSLSSYQPATTGTFLVQRMTVWSCSSWQISNCASLPDTGTP